MEKRTSDKCMTYCRALLSSVCNIYNTFIMGVIESYPDETSVKETMSCH